MASTSYKNPSMSACVSRDQRLGYEREHMPKTYADLENALGALENAVMSASEQRPRSNHFAHVERTPHTGDSPILEEFIEFMKAKLIDRFGNKIVTKYHKKKSSRGPACVNLRLNYRAKAEDFI